ncbi:MAG: outer membrane beta-barrel protein [Bacteroidetes bacterium]|nr:outer membrane beta-barrel protein [Bacteroidota bacterium]
MLKVLPIFSLFFLISFSSAAQKKSDVQPIKSGDIQVNCGIGLVPTFFMDKATVVAPPLKFGLDYYVSPRFSLDFSAGFSSSSFDKFYHDTTSKCDCGPMEVSRTYAHNYYFFNLRPTIHIEAANVKWDVYGGFSMGYAISDINPNEGNMDRHEMHVGIKERQSGFAFSGYFGAKYCLGKNIRLLGEVGYGISLVQLGIAYKI